MHSTKYHQHKTAATWKHTQPCNSGFLISVSFSGRHSFWRIWTFQGYVQAAGTPHQTACYNWYPAACSKAQPVFQEGFPWNLRHPLNPTATIREGQAGRLPLGAAAQNKGTPGRYSLSFDGPNIRARRSPFQTSSRQIPSWKSPFTEHGKAKVQLSHILQTDFPTTP